MKTEQKKTDIVYLPNVPCPHCKGRLKDAFAKSSLATRGVLIEGKCPEEGNIIQVRLSDGKLYTLGGEEPYSKPKPPKRKTAYNKKMKLEEYEAGKNFPKMRMRGSPKWDKP